jgi:hypothetical protein
MRAKAKDALLTAYHEAGHVIACDELNVLHDGLSILARADGTAGRAPVEGDDGFVIPRGTDPNSPENEAGFRAWAETQSVIDYAGHAAIVVLLGPGDMGDKSAQAEGASNDFEKAAMRLGADQQRIEQAKERALAIISARRADVEKLSSHEAEAVVLGVLRAVLEQRVHKPDSSSSPPC